MIGKRGKKKSKSASFVFLWFASLLDYYNWLVKVVDIINRLSDDVRPRVLVSATAIGYYGECYTN